MLHQLAAGETAGKAEKLIGDLPLFSAAIRQEDSATFLLRGHNYISNIGVPPGLAAITIGGQQDPRQIFAPHGYDLVVDTPDVPRASNSRAHSIFARHRETQQAINLPNFGSMNGPTLLEENRFPPATVEALRARGAEVREMNMTSGLQAITRGQVHGKKMWLGGADPRREGVVMGELDLRLESSAAAEFAANTEKDEGFQVPKPVWMSEGAPLSGDTSNGFYRCTLPYENAEDNWRLADGLLCTRWIQHRRTT